MAGVLGLITGVLVGRRVTLGALDRYDDSRRWLKRDDGDRRHLEDTHGKETL